MQNPAADLNGRQEDGYFEFFRMRRTSIKVSAVVTAITEPNKIIKIWIVSIVNSSQRSFRMFRQHHCNFPTSSTIPARASDSGVNGVDGNGQPITGSMWRYDIAPAHDCVTFR